jgi:hypothetical protein
VAQKALRTSAILYIPPREATDDELIKIDKIINLIETDVTFVCSQDPAIGPHLRHYSSVHITTPYLLKIYLNVIIPKNSAVL